VVAVYGPIIPIESRFKYKVLIGAFNKLAHFAATSGIFHATLGSNTAIRRDVFQKIGGYSDMSAGDDYEIARRLRHEGAIRYDPMLSVHFSNGEVWIYTRTVYMGDECGGGEARNACKDKLYQADLSLR